MCPMFSLSQSVTLFLSSGAQVCSGVTNKKEKDGGYKRSGRTLVRRAESDGSPAMS